MYYVCILFYRSPRSPSHSPSLSLSFFKYGVSVSCYFYMPFAYRYPTNILQYPDRTAFALAALMLSSLGTATYTCWISLGNWHV